MTLPLRFWLLVLLIFSALSATAQNLDPAFTPTALTNSTGAIRVMLRQPDGKVVIGGGYDFVDGVLTGKVRRLNADGSLDIAFQAQTGTGPDIGDVQALALQPDGKILVGAQTMTYYNGVYASGIARLNTDGSVDATFNAGGTGVMNRPNSFNPNVRSLAVQPDGKILVGVWAYDGVQYYNGQALQGLIRLNPDGSIDTGFNLGTGMRNSAISVVIVDAILVQADGKIVVGGYFDSVNGTAVKTLVRLNSNGTVDNSFAIGSGLTIGNGSYSVRSLLQQPDGKLLIGGGFYELNGVPCSNLIRLNLNGSLDNTFAATGGGDILHLRLKADGSILVAGSFTSFNGAPRGGIAKVNSSGTLDATFVSGTGATGGSTYDVLELANGQLLAGGSFSAYNGAARTGLVRLSTAAALDASYNPVQESKGSIQALAPLPNGQLLAQGGYLTKFNGTAIPGTTSNIHLLNANGSYNGPVSGPALTGTVVMQPNGQLYVKQLNPTPQTITLTRALSSGLADASFAPATISNASGSNIDINLITTAAGLFLAGDFTSVNGVARTGLARLLPDGTLDAAFAPARPWGPLAFYTNYYVNVASLPNGKAMVSWTDATRSYLLQLLPNGSPDPAFSIGSATGFFDVVPQPDGRLLVSGVPGGLTSFTSFNGQAAPNGLLRLLPTGAPDPSFNPALALRRLLVQPDGRILGTGSTHRPGNQLRRLNADGSTDSSFPAVSIPEPIYIGSGIIGYALQPADGKIILFGDFTSVAGQQRIGLARLTNTLLATRPAFAAAPELDLFPNPAQQQITLRLPTTAVLATAQPVDLLDMQGRTVRHFTLPARQTEVTFPLADVAAGIYLLQTSTSQGPARQRVVVTH